MTLTSLGGFSEQGLASVLTSTIPFSEDLDSSGVEVSFCTGFSWFSVFSAWQTVFLEFSLSSSDDSSLFLTSPAIKDKMNVSMVSG